MRQGDTGERDSTNDKKTAPNDGVTSLLAGDRSKKYFRFRSGPPVEILKEKKQ